MTEDIREMIDKINNLKRVVNENIQLADKIYFNTGKLSKEDREIILNITNGNNYTKIIADFYFYLKNIAFNTDELVKQLKPIYNDVINYNKNVYPIIGYDTYNPENVSEIIYGIEKRRKIIAEISKLPSVATRNLRDDIRKERTSKELTEYLHDLEYFMANYSLLSNRDKETQFKIFQKMFKGNTTLDQLMRFVDEKQNFIGGVEFTRDDILNLSETEDFEIIYADDADNVMIAKVNSPSGIKAIGCNSLWCFTYGSGLQAAYNQWNSYSYNDMVYVLIDFREKSDSEDFMHVLIKPLTNDNGRFIKYNEDNEYDHPIFNMANDNYNNPYSILKHLFGDNYKKVINKYLNFEY